MEFRKLISWYLIVCILLQNILFLFPNMVSAAPDADGSANIDLYLTPTIPSSSIIGKNFTLDIALESKNTSDGDGYRPGIVLNLPAGVSLVNAGTLGSPTRTVNHSNGTTLLFFQTSGVVLLKGLTNHYPITLTSSNAAGVFVNKDIGILGYIDDSIYGRGVVPTGAPMGTLTGGIDYAAGSGVSMADPTNLTFPANVNSGTVLSTLPFIKPVTQFTPFDVTKEEGIMNLIGKPVITTLKVHGNSMGSLKHFHLQDVIPSNRAFNGFITTTGATIGGLHVTYDMPSPGFTTIDITDITVPTGTDVSILYETIPLAYTIASYSGSTPILNSGSIVPHDDLSRNTVTMHTGALALVGGPYAPTTWNDGSSDILVDNSSLLPPRSVDTHNRYANLSKSANVSEAVIGDLVTYTIHLDTAKNAAFTTNGSGTYITDILPDGMTYSGTVSSTISGVGTPLTFVSFNPNGDGDTEILWRLNSGEIGADSIITIVYQAVVDGIYQGAGDTEYENTEVLVNSASFFGTIGDGSLSGIWGITDPSIIDTTVAINNITATIKAPIPTTKKHLISVTTPGGSVYDYTTGLPSNIPPGSALRFAVTMDFPNVDFINPKVIDALPLLAGPNMSTYNIAFQTNTTLKDIYNSGVLFNTNDGVTPSASFNGLNLSGTTIPNSPWIQATSANNLEFTLGNGRGEKTFAILFTVDVLASKPVGGLGGIGLVPLTNFAYSSFNDDTAAPNPLPVMEIPFDVNFPTVTATKTVSGGTNIEAGKDIEYLITLTNTGSGPAFLENIIDVLPSNMDFVSGSIVHSGSLSELSNTAFTQSGNVLSISFDTGGLAGPRSYIPLNNTGTLSEKENIVVVRYTVRPNTNFVIQGGATRTNTVTLDYYASSGAVSNGVNNLGPVTATANITVKSPTLSRSVYSTSEADSSGVNLLVGEEVVYRTIITLPQGTFNLANYIETINANLQFVSGAVVAYSGALSFSSGTTFSGVSLPFGAIVNSDASTGTLETIVIDTTYRSKITATAGNNYANNGIFTYSSTSTSSSLNVNVVKPTVTLTKVASTASGQYGTIVGYTVTVNNTSTTAPIYDLFVRDILPVGMDYVTGSLSAFSFSGTESDLFASGLTLDSISTSSGRSFTFQATPKASVRPADILTNQATVAYDTLDDDLSLYEWTGSTTGTANFTITDLALTHVITSTNLADTTSALFSGSLADVAIGEEITYTTDITVPQSTFTGFTITQTLPVGMKFLSGSISFDGIKSHTLSNIVIGPNNVITFSLGDVDNTGIGAGSGITLVTQAVMQDNPLNIAGSVKTSSLLVNYSEKSKSINRSIEVVEPTLVVNKTYSPASGDAGDTIPTTITVHNSGSVTAYDVVLTDIPANKTTPDGGFSGTINIGILAPGETRTYTYNSIINSNVFPGENLTGTASISYTSFPGSPTEGERVYTALDTDFINIINVGSIIHTRVSSEFARIGDVVQYEIRVPVSEGSMGSLVVTNTIPTGMAILPASVAISTSPGLTFSGTVSPVITPDSDSIITGQTQGVVYNFTDVANIDTDNGATEYITIRYDAIILNSSDTNINNTKTHTSNANYEGGAIVKNGTSLPVTIIEPVLTLTVSNGYTNGYTVPYTFTITNTGTSTAYDLGLTTLLPIGVTYTGAISITNSGGAVNLIQTGDSFTLDSLPVNTGNPLTFTILGQVSNIATNGTIYTLTGTVRYTSEPGLYGSVISNILNTERSSNGGIDDYIDANKATSFTLNLALLDETIDVVDLNGGVGLIDDIFEYTITLNNTGTVALSGIPVTLDIPTGFTGFTIQSIPVGSTDISISTGGVNSAGFLSVTGIDIPVGQSRTIVYRVTALHTVIPGITIPTIANVGDSVEGAIGGFPSVPVTIHAPRFVSSAIEIDTNSGSLYQTEYIHHIVTLTNTGTATGTNISVIIPWNTGSTYTTGSIIFQTGTLINTGTILVDEILNRITFTISVLPPGFTETIVFDSRATGPINSIIGTEISATSDENISTNSTSNLLVIVNKNIPISAGAGGGGGGSSSYTPLISILPTEPIPVSKKPKTPTNIDVIPKIKEVKKLNDPKADSISLVYQDYLSKLARLNTLIAEETASGIMGIKYPKVLPQTGISILERVKKLINPNLSLQVPKFSKGGKNVSDNLSFWLSDLPKEDHKREEYIVIPSNGMITPINTVVESTSDYTKLVNGREIEVNKYLKTGVMTYPGTNKNGFGSVGNTVIFGHSSYFALDNGRYKTHFQKIIELEAGEEVWIYKKQLDGNYKRFRYTTVASYETKSNDVSVLNTGIGKNLTLFTCTPIGGIAGRWIIKAKYIDEEKIYLDNYLNGRTLSQNEKKIIGDFIKTIKSQSVEKKKESLLQKFGEISLENKSPYSEYYLLQIAKNYYKLQ